MASDNNNLTCPCAERQWLRCNAFLGGIAVNYDTNSGAAKNRVYVVEADDYDRSFLKLNPDIAVINRMDEITWISMARPDHGRSVHRIQSKSKGRWVAVASLD
jgi:hypothetical protein